MPVEGVEKSEEENHQASKMHLAGTDVISRKLEKENQYFRHFVICYLIGDSERLSGSNVVWKSLLWQIAC